MSLLAEAIEAVRGMRTADVPRKGLDAVVQCRLIERTISACMTIAYPTRFVRNTNLMGWTREEPKFGRRHACSIPLAIASEEESLIVIGKEIALQAQQRANGAETMQFYLSVVPRVELSSVVDGITRPAPVTHALVEYRLGCDD